MGKRNDCRKIVIVMGLALILTFASGCQDKKQEGKGITDDILSDQTDYSMYLRKIWMEGHDHLLHSLVITRIEDGSIEGFLGEDRTYSDMYFDIDWAGHSINFQGKVSDGHAECIYHNGQENRYGLMDITFAGENGLDVRIDGGETKNYQTCSISDIQYRDTPVTNEGEMGLLGKVTLYCVYKENADTFEPWVVLLDEQGDVIYQFSENFVGYDDNSDCEITGTAIGDMDGDGLEDIVVFAHVSYTFRDDLDRQCEWYFFQQEDGWFGKEVYICYFGDEDAYYIESERNDIHVLFREPEGSADE